MTTYIIKTSGGTGSPGYADDKAPNGAQWIGANGLQQKIPEGTQIIFTGKNNAFDPPYSQVKILDGMFINSLVWIKSTHVVEETAMPPPQPEPTGEWVEYDQKWEGGKYYLRVVK